MRYFITGTDTDVGKTYVTCLLLRAMAAAGHPAVGYKPICCGSRDDAVALHAASAPATEPLALDDVNPLFYPMPAAPMAAAMVENRPVHLETLHAGYNTLAQRYEHILVEGAGGWEVPVRADYRLSDWAAALGLPVIVVVNNRLGALNHTLLTVAAIRARHLRCAGLILNAVTDTRDSASISNAPLLRALLPDVPILADVMHGETTLAWDDLTDLHS
jgi:dethiobiotin synthetase